MTTVFEPYIDSRKASAFLGVSPRTLNEMARKGEIPAYPWGHGKVRKTWRFRVSDLDSYMKSKLQSAQPLTPSSRRKR